MRSIEGQPRLKRRTPRPSSADAFSLVELVLVTTIIGIIAAVAVPRYANSLTRYRAEAAARRVVADLELAAAQARTTSTLLSVVFDAGADRYQIPGLDHFLGGSPQGFTIYTVPLSEAPYHAKLLSADFSGDAKLNFNGFGEANASGNVVVAVGRTKRTVVFDQVSGEATIQ